MTILIYLSYIQGSKHNVYKVASLPLTITREAKVNEKDAFSIDHEKVIDTQYA